MLSTTAYLIDVYALNANSALAAYVSIRSVTAFAFPLFAAQMFQKLGVSWAASLLAYLCVALAPAPFLFWRYGANMPSWSRFAFETPSGGKS
jgi:MFS transporter, DHA1 family, multidrug resistance protein